MGDLEGLAFQLGPDDVDERESHKSSPGRPQEELFDDLQRSIGAEDSSF